MYLAVDEHHLAILKLHLADGVGAVTYRKLVRAFGSAEAALWAPKERVAELAGIGERIAAAVEKARSECGELAKRELELASAHGVRIVTIDDTDYPRALKTIYDPPLVLYVKGEVLPRDGLALAIVGSRRCTYYGKSQAERFAGHLAGLGFTIVSGLAHGIDAAAHRGALASSGRTIAVLGCGLARMYPSDHKELAEEIASKGALLSELPMETEPSRETFPRRNRIISGLSLGVLVVEGDTRSGALITARAALEQGREVFALPGKVDSPTSRGPHLLIKEGAKLVEGPEDILEELGPSADVLGLAEAAKGGPSAQSESSQQASEPTALPGLSPSERRLYECLSSDPRDIDDITAELGMSPAEVSAGLLVLEIRRLVRQLPGKRFVRIR